MAARSRRRSGVGDCSGARGLGEPTMACGRAAVVAFLAQSFTGHGIAREWAAFRHISKREIGATPKMEQTNTDDPRMAKIWRGFAADMFAMQQEGCRNKVLML
jgi:hypothetical protein